jgi:hypothetical protein
MWTLMPQQQQCGAQLHARPGTPGSKACRPGEAPGEAVADRAAQDHEQAHPDVSGGSLQAGDYPASQMENRDGGGTPSAPDDPSVEWDNVVQPERPKQQRGGGFDRLPLPEEK